MAVRVENELKVQSFQPKEDVAKNQSTIVTILMTSGNTDSVGDNTSLGNTRQKVGVKAHLLDYSNFGGKSKADEATAYASEVLDTVEDALKNLQRNYPGAQVELEQFPDPKEFTKKKFGKDGAYNAWKQEVRNWRQDSMTAINTFADKSHKEVVNDATKEVKGTIYNAYADLKGGQLQIVQQLIDLGQLTKEGFNKLAKQMDYDINKVIRYISQAKREIIANDNRNTKYIVGTVQDEASTLHEHLDYNSRGLAKLIETRALKLYYQADKNKEEIKGHTSKETHQTQELDAIGKRVTDNLTHTDVIHTPETVNRISSMLETVVKSDLPQEQKVELADEIADLSKDTIISDKDMDNLEGKVNRAIRENIHIDREEYDD